MAVKRIIRSLLLPAALSLAAPPLRAQEPVTRDAQGVTINLVNVDLRAAVQMLAVHVDRPVFFGQVGDHRITFTSPRPIPAPEIPGLLRQMVGEYGYVMEEVEGAYRIRPQQQAPPAPRPGPPRPQQQAPGGPSLASANGMELFVIRLRHARAADVAATVNALYGRASALGEVGQRRGTLNDELNANRAGAYGQDQAQQAAAPPAPSGNLSGNVVIVPDFRTNSLLIRASRPDYELISAAVGQVDVRPLQVLIEATVAYVSRDFNFGYGLRAAVGDVPIDGSENTTVGGSTVDGDGPADLVIRALNLGGIDLNLILRAGQSRSNVVILDRPLLLAANNEEAEIVVGEQRPFVQVQRSTDGGVLDEVVQYKDVGTTLRVLPTISADGFVQLQVTQEVNSAAGSAEGMDAPVISTRAISTELLVRDGHTAVLGGLSNTQRDRSSGGIPFLSDLPLIGGIFGRKERGDNQFELFIFITPHVLDSDEEMDEASGEIEQRRNMRRAIKGPPLVTPDVPAENAQQPAEAAAPAQTVPAPEEQP